MQSGRNGLTAATLCVYMIAHFFVQVFTIKEPHPCPFRYRLLKCWFFLPVDKANVPMYVSNVYAANTQRHCVPQFVICKPQISVGVAHCPV